MAIDLSRLHQQVDKYDNMISLLDECTNDDQKQNKNTSICGNLLLTKIDNAVQYLSSEIEVFFHVEPKSINNEPQITVHKYPLTAISKYFDKPDIKLVRSSREVQSWLLIFKKLNYSRCNDKDVQIMTEKIQRAMKMVVEIMPETAKDKENIQHLVQQLGKLYIDYHFWILWKQLREFTKSFSIVDDIQQKLNQELNISLGIEYDVLTGDTDNEDDDNSLFMDENDTKTPYEDVGDADENDTKTLSELQLLLFNARQNWLQQTEPIVKKMKGEIEKLTHLENSLSPEGIYTLMQEEQRKKNKKQEMITKYKIQEAFLFYKKCLKYVE
eukprot:26193_1